MAKKKPIHPFYLWLLSTIAPVWFWLIRVTGKWHHHRQEHRDALLNGGKPFVVGFWHGRIMLSAFLKQMYDGRFMMLSSNHRDADLIIHAVRRMGIEFVRGSSANPLKKHKRKSGSSGTLALIKAMEEGALIGMTPDGPRGPRQRLQPGIVQIAKITGAPILPIGASTTSGKEFDSWDRFLLALPFGDVHFCYGEPIYVTGETEEELQQSRLQVEQTLTSLMREADALCHRPSPETAPERPRTKRATILDDTLMDETSS